MTEPRSKKIPAVRARTFFPTLLLAALVALLLATNARAQTTAKSADDFLSQPLTNNAANTARSLNDNKSEMAAPRSSQQDEVERLRGEVKELRGEIERLSKMVKALTANAKAQPEGSPLPQRPSPLPQTRADEMQPAADAPQSTAAPEDRRIAVATKAQGGDLSGAGNLLRTDRITVGGYGDFQFRTSSISERADGGGTPTFQNTRFVLGIAAVLSERQNITFNSELEYEFGSREIDVEQAFVEWKMRPQFAVRGGIFAPAIGRFNVYHDSNLNLATIRPLINQFIVPTAYRDAGVGFRGRFNLPRKMKLSYEFDVVNGMRATNANGEPTPFSRLLGQSSAAEPGDVAFQAHTRRKAVVGRLALSPLQGFEFGASAYNGRFTLEEEAPQSATILFFDASYHRGNLAINGEYARSNIVGGIPRRSPAPPVFKLDDPNTITELAEFVAQRSPGQDGFYVEASYQLQPQFVRNHFDDSGYIAPVFRYEVVRLDRTLKDFYLNRSRATVGLNIAPSSRVIFKFDYLFNHTLGVVPRTPSSIGESLFGENPLPHRNYGHNGFTGSVAYVF